jgi:hypothetical protein
MEADARLDQASGYEGFAAKARRVRRDLLAFLRKARVDGALVAAYGAAAKGNTLLNYCGVDSALVRFVADRSAAKQGKLLPGSRIPVLTPEAIAEARPDYLLILPWNLLPELKRQLGFVQDWGGRLITAIPEIRIA